MTDTLSMRRRILGDRAVTSCLHTRRQLQRYLDGETDPSLAARIARHLAACRACGLEADTYRAIRDSLHRHAGPPPADALDRLATFAATLLGQGG